MSFKLRASLLILTLALALVLLPVISAMQTVRAAEQCQQDGKLWVGVGAEPCVARWTTEVSR